MKSTIDTVAIESGSWAWAKERMLQGGYVRVRLLDDACVDAALIRGQGDFNKFAAGCVVSKPVLSKQEKVPFEPFVALRIANLSVFSSSKLPSKGWEVVPDGER